MRTGISSPFYQGFREAEPGPVMVRSPLRVVISETTSASSLQRVQREHRSGSGYPKAEIRDSVFEPRTCRWTPILSRPISDELPDGTERFGPRDRSLFTLHHTPGDNFKVFYSLEARSVAPCHDTRLGIGGWCASRPAHQQGL